MSRTRLDEVLARKKVLHEKRLALNKQSSINAAEAAAAMKAQAQAQQAQQVQQAQQAVARKVVTHQPVQPMSSAIVTPAQAYEEQSVSYEEKKAVRKPVRKAVQQDQVVVEVPKVIEAPKPPVEAPKASFESSKSSTDVKKVAKVQYEEEKDDYSDYSDHSDSEHSDSEHSEQYSDEEERGYEDDEDDLGSVKEELVAYEESKKKAGRRRKNQVAAQEVVEQREQQAPSRQSQQAIQQPAQQDAEANPIPKKSLINLIKRSGVESITKDVIDACFEVLEQVIEGAIGQRTHFSINDASSMITHQFKNGEEDLPEDVVIASVNFQRFATSIFAKHKCNVRREAFFMLHLYCEAYLIKMMKAASIIAKNNSRSRVQGGDLAVAYYIHSM